MADRGSPDAFANDLTGVYATDPNYGASLITLMRQYNLYHYDASTAAAGNATTSQGNTAAASGLGGGRECDDEPRSEGGGGSRCGRVRYGRGGLSDQRAGGDGGCGDTGDDPAEWSGARRGGAPGVRTSGGEPGDPAFFCGSQVLGPDGRADGQQSGGPRRRIGPFGHQGGPGGGRRGIGLSEHSGVVDGTAGVAAVAWPVLSAATRMRRSGSAAVKAGPGNARISTRRYAVEVPRTVTTDFISSAKTPLLRAEPIYREVADGHGIRWELLAACDWMQCQAQPRISPVYGESLGTKNPDGTIYRSKTEALDQVAADLIELAAVVYGINLRQRLLLSVRELASVFAAFRWGGLLRAHRVSAMEFPYSVEGLTAAHLKMRWPEIPVEAPDKPGTRFRKPFGAVPVVLGLDYPAVA